MDTGGEFFKIVPRGFNENLVYREIILSACHRSKKFRDVIMQICKEDVLFWLSTFCWLVEPRIRFNAEGKELPRSIPFIPWDHQIPAIQTIKANLGLKDIAVYKSRGEGLSWIAVLLGLHDWMFESMSKVGIVSSTELKADDPGNLDSLFGKLDWEIQRLPRWMIGERDKDWRRLLTSHSLVNLRNGSQLNAFAATADTGRSGRYKWFMADELAFWEAGKDRKFMESIRASTECRLAISTPNGAEGAFYDMIHVPSNTVKVRVHWTQNNDRMKGMYKIVDGRPVPVDGLRNPMPKDYIGPSEDVQNLFSRLRAKGFRLEGKIRSPWYDNECDKADSTPQSIAQEYDLDFGGSMYRVFSAEFMEKTRDTIIRPLHQGIIDFHPETLEVEYTDRPDAGECKLWVELDGRGRPPLGVYVAAADISSGLGGSHTSNSVLQVINRVTGEQVLEWASNMIEPSDFAKLCVAISKWFYDAYLGWEANFGGGFTRRVLQLGYGNVYYRTVHWKRGHKKQKEVGWWTDDRTKELLFSDMHRKTRAGECVLRSEDLVRECGEYIRSGPKSAIVHVLSANTPDESSRGKAHGDRVIAYALGLQLIEDRPLDDNEGETAGQGPPASDTLAWRVEQWDRQDRPQNEWDDGTLGDIARRGLGSGFID
jgi:hypothetical protein